jgi:hypothetical protein
VLIRVGGSGLAARPWIGRLARTLITAVAAVVVALVVGKAPARYAPYAVLAAPLLVLLLVLVRRVDPKWFLAALMFSMFFGWWQISSSVGGVNLRVTDIPFLLLVGSLLFMSGRTIAQRADVGQRLLATLLLVFGLSLIPVFVLESNEFFSSFVSWARLVETFSIIWLMPYVVKRPSDARFVMGVVAGACATELGRALIDAAVKGQLSGRLQGGNGPDSEGMLAAVLIVTVIYGMVPRRALGRAALIGLAVLALVLSKSVASFVAVGLVLALAPPPRAAGHNRKSGLWRPLQLVIVVGAVVFAVVGVRSANVPGSSKFVDSSTMARVVLGAGGVDMFLHHPIFGVGFSRSELASVMGDPTVVSDLHRWFPTARPDLFPNVLNCRNTHTLTSAGPSSACFLGGPHNAYIEVGAEAGVIGLGTLLVVAVGIRRRMRKIRAQTTDPEILTALRWATLVLVVVLIWWNDNPLFGAHPETLLAGLALGMFAVPWNSYLAGSQPSPGEFQAVGSRAG